MHLRVETERSGTRGGLTLQRYVQPLLEPFDVFSKNFLISPSFDLKNIVIPYVINHNKFTSVRDGAKINHPEICCELTLSRYLR